MYFGVLRVSKIMSPKGMRRLRNHGDSMEVPGDEGSPPGIPGTPEGPWEPEDVLRNHLKSMGVLRVLERSRKPHRN